MADRTDFAIVGSGIAGLRAAIALASAGRVLILTKADPAESNTGYAQGGIAAALGDDDSPALHAADTIRAGDGLCDEEAVRVLVEDGPRYVQELVDWGTAFDRDADGRLALGREAAHSVRRVLHAGDATGREIGRALWHRVSGLATVFSHNHAFVIDIVVEDGAAVGVQGTARDISERKGTQLALQTYARRVVEAQEAERQNIARELHDEIGQILTAVSLFHAPWCL